MQLAADYLSHSRLTSILICEREREVNDRGQGGMRRGRERERVRWRGERLEKGEKRKRELDMKQSEKVLVFVAAKLLIGERRLAGKHFGLDIALKEQKERRGKGERGGCGKSVLLDVILMTCR